MESFPQIALQVFLLFKTRELKRLGEDAGGEAMDVDEFSIVASLMCACLHVILELSNLYLESKTSQSSFRDYMVACYNARQGWLPQEGDFFKINDDDESEK